MSGNSTAALLHDPPFGSNRTPPGYRKTTGTAQPEPFTVPLTLKPQTCNIVVAPPPLPPKGTREKKKKKSTSTRGTPTPEMRWAPGRTFHASAKWNSRTTTVMMSRMMKMVIWKVVRSSRSSWRELRRDSALDVPERARALYLRKGGQGGRGT